MSFTAVSSAMNTTIANNPIKNVKRPNFLPMTYPLIVPPFTVINVVTEKNASENMTNCEENNHKNDDSDILYEISNARRLASCSDVTVGSLRLNALSWE